MALSNVERQRIWRERHRGEPRGNKVLMTQLAALQARVDQLEADQAARPQPAPTKPTDRLRKTYAALKRERDELAERMAAVEAFQPGITAEAQAWIKQVDAPPRRRRKPVPT
ncbi:MAG: hypothetical protein ACJ8AI_07690 [Rhodopila sp.]